MAIQYRNLLPKRIRNSRWGELIDVFQATIDDIKNTYIYRLRDKYNKDEMDEESYQDLIYRFGYDLPFFKGYTSTLAFFKKQAESLVKQIQYKTAPRSYQYAYYIYNMLGYVLPQRLQSGIYIPQYSAAAGIDVSKSIVQFDQQLPYIEFYSGGVAYPNDPPIPTGLPELTFDSADETDPNAQFLFFDGNAELDYCNHFALSYDWKFVESVIPPVFSSPETTRSFYESTQQLKRKIAIIHYQPRIIFELDSSGAVVSNEIFLEDLSNSTYVSGIYLDHGIPLTDITKVRFGIGSFNVLSTSITDVEVFTQENSLSTDWFIRNVSSTNLEIELKMDEYTRYTFNNQWAISELIFLDTLDQPVAYIKFPKIHFYELMYNSVYLNISVV